MYDIHDAFKSLKAENERLRREKAALEFKLKAQKQAYKALEEDRDFWKKGARTWHARYMKGV